MLLQAFYVCIICTTVFLEAFCDVLRCVNISVCSWLLNSVVNYWMPLDQWLLIWDCTSWCSHSSGISHSAKGYCLISVLETMKTYSAEEGLTEEAVVTKLRICRYHHLYLHSSLRNNSSGCNLYSWTFLFILIMIFFWSRSNHFELDIRIF